MMQEHDESQLEGEALHETIVNDRRITRKNIFRWTDELLRQVVNFHRVYSSVGDIRPIHVHVAHDNDHTLQIKRALIEMVLEAFKQNQSLGTVNLGDLESVAVTSKRKKPQNARTAALDFTPFVRLATSPDQRGEQRTISEYSSNTHLGHRLPRPFDSVRLQKFDFKHDGTICIP